MIKKTGLFILTSLFIGSAHSADTAEILEFYPSCQYEVLDTITVQQSLINRRNDSDTDVIELTVQKLLERIVKSATNQDASGIILIGKKVKKNPTANDVTLTRESSTRIGFVSFEAELLSGCDGEYTFSDNRTRYNKSGEPQSKLEIATSQVDIKLTLPPLNLRKPSIKQPSLATKDISIEEGVFGVIVGMTIDDVSDVLGSPTSEFQIASNMTIQSYGRNLWVAFEDDAVVQITNENRWLSGQLVNLLEFDNRIPVPWQMTNGIKQGMSAESLLKTGLGEFLDDKTYRISGDNNTVIEISLSPFITAPGQSGLQAENYTYGNTEVKVRIAKDRFVFNNDTLYQRIYDLLSNKADIGNNISANTIDAMPVLRARDIDGRLIRVYDSNLAIIFENDNLTDLFFAESLFHNQSEKTEWTFGQISHDQSENAVRNVFGDDIYERDFDHWEVFSGDFKYDLFFEEANDELLLSSFDLKVF